jgi:chromosome partitioning protein
MSGYNTLEEVALKRIVVTNQKGGSGKTTIAGNLAWEMSRAIPTLLIDTDDQASASSWAKQWEGVKLAHITDPNHLRKTLVASTGHGLIIVDCPPHDPTLALTAVPGADLVIVPVTPSPFDLWSARPLLSSLTGKIPLLVVMNRGKAGTKTGLEARGVLLEIGVPVADTALINRVAYVEAVMAHKPVALYAPKSAAAKETRALAKEIAQIIKVEVANE